jgi:hypothetical protein
MLVLGGGGYTIRNVSRAWAFETSILLEEEVSNNIPYNDYFEFYAPNFKLHLEPDPDLENANSREYLDECKYVKRAAVPSSYRLGDSRVCPLFAVLPGRKSLRISVR